jgi:hypothetical protein
MLQNNYGKRGWVKVENKLITTDGSDVVFYEGGSGHTNSVIRSHIGITVSSDEISEVLKNSESLISVLKDNPNTKWLHIDVEGIDDDLILSIRGNEHLLPELIIYEHESLTQEKENVLCDFLRSNGYTIYKGYSRNTLALR